MMLALITSLGGSAQAQSIPGSTDYEPPALGVDYYRPSTDSQYALQVEDTHKPDDFVMGLETWWVRDPLVWYDNDGLRNPIVGDAMALAATAALGFGPVRVGMVAPVYLHSTGQGESRGSVLGDPSLELRVARSRDGLGLGAAGRLVAPLGASAQQLGQAGWSYEVSGIADFTGDSFWVGANIGFRGVPQVDLPDVSLNDQLIYRLGAAWVASPVWSVSGELQGFATLSALQSGATGNPREFLASGHRNTDTRRLSLGVGVGQGAGIGAPRWRVVLGAGAQSLAQTPASL
ncbi:MAG: hypothetical protein ACI9VR_000192 [Cognaticolwellia sp.]|jgi:hypothetical protein